MHSIECPVSSWYNVVGLFVQMTSVNYMDRCMMKLYKERADRLLKRRQEDVKDQSLEYMPGILHSTFVIKTHNNSTNSSAVSVV